MYVQDAQQQALNFMVQQAAHIEPQVPILYPDIQYPQLVPVDTSANEWANTITFFSMDKVGQADWFSGLAKDMPQADVTKAKHDHTIHMAGIGYGYTLEEISQAMMIPGTNLSADRAMAARRACEEFIDGLVINGDTSKNLTGLVNDSNVTAVQVAADGTGSSRLWSTKTGELIVRDINDLLTGAYTASNTVELCDTLLLSPERLAYIGTKLMTTGDGSRSVLSFLKEHNIYTMVTGQPLTIRAVRGLSTAGTGSTQRMIAYKRDPNVVKLHLPMPHRFLPVWQTGPIRFDVPGIFRTGGIEVRRPGAFRYGDSF